MTGRRRLLLAALALLIVTLVLPGRAAAADACTTARALALWQATASRLHDLLGGPIPPPPRILIDEDAQNLPGREPGLAVIGGYSSKSQTIRVSCSNGGVLVFDATVRHELAHYFLHTWIAHIPKWLDEGLATTMEAGSLNGGTLADHVNEPRLREYVDMLKFGIVPRLSDVIDEKPLTLTPSQEYATYWALAFALLYNADPAIQERRRALVHRLLATAAETEDTAQAVEQVFLENTVRAGSNSHWEMRWHREIWTLR